MRKVINRIIDKITGFPLDESLKEVVAIDGWNRSQIDAYQQKMFAKLKSFAVKSEVYKDCGDLDFKDFPIYTKEFYGNNHEKFLTNFRKPYKKISTSGSTGAPREIVVSKEMLLAKRVSHLKMLSWYGIGREDLELYMSGFNLGMKYKIYYFLKNKIFIPSFNINEEKAIRIIELMNKRKPILLFAYPFTLDIILRYIENSGMKLHQPKVIYTGAENIYPYMIDRIKKNFPESIYVNEYWSTEANIAVGCPHGNIHIDEDTVIVEAVNLDENGIGEALITNLYSYDFPLIRYPIGDRVKLSDKTCTCGRNTRIIEQIAGRTADYINLPNGKILTFTENGMPIAALCKDEVLYYQLVYDKSNGEGIFYYVPKNSKSELNKSAIENYLLKNAQLRVKFQQTEHISTEKSGKYKIFKSIN
jgi:phenylacetate-CoA ligase